METVWLFSSKQWGIQQTEQYIDDLARAFDFLADNPKAGTACEHIRTGYRKYPVLRHAVYYRETTYGVKIIRVLHDRMLAARYF